MAKIVSAGSGWRFGRFQRQYVLMVLSATVLLSVALAVESSGERFDGDWTTHLGCKAHQQAPA